MADELTITQAAQMLGLSRTRIHQLIRGGRLPARRVGPVLVLPKKSVRAYRPRPSGRPRKAS